MGLISEQDNLTKAYIKFLILYKELNGLELFNKLTFAVHLTFYLINSLIGFDYHNE